MNSPNIESPSGNSIPNETYRIRLVQSPTWERARVQQKLLENTSSSRPRCTLKRIHFFWFLFVLTVLTLSWIFIILWIPFLEKSEEISIDDRDVEFQQPSKLHSGIYDAPMKAVERKKMLQKNRQLDKTVSSNGVASAKSTGIELANSNLESLQTISTDPLLVDVSVSTIFNEWPFKAAIHRPTPWLPFHSEGMKDEHQRKYDEWSKCMDKKSATAISASNCFNLINQKYDNYDGINWFEKHMDTIEQSVADAPFPKRWLKNFNPSTLTESSSLGMEYAKKVVNAVNHTYISYKSFGWGRDEILPLSLASRDWCGLSVTMIDSLSTLWLVGAYDEFYEAVNYVIKEVAKFKVCLESASFFEITIRVFGGILSAATLSGHSGLIKTAELMGRRYLASLIKGVKYTCPWDPSITSKKLYDFYVPLSQSPDFDNDCYNASNHPLHFNASTLEDFIFPSRTISLCSPPNDADYTVVSTTLAQSGTFQLEFRTLSMLTGDYRYQELADHVTYRIQNISQSYAEGYSYLPRHRLSPLAGPTGDYTVGGESDSYVEMLIKEWIQTGKTEYQFLSLWNGVIDDIISVLFVTSPSISGVTSAVDIPRWYLQNPNELESTYLNLSSSSFDDKKKTLQDYIALPTSMFSNDTSESSTVKDIYQLIQHLRSASGKISLKELISAGYGFPASHHLPIATNRLKQRKFAQEFQHALELLTSWDDPYWKKSQNLSSTGKEDSMENVLSKLTPQMNKKNLLKLLRGLNDFKMKGEVGIQNQIPQSIKNSQNTENDRQRLLEKISSSTNLKPENLAPILHHLYLLSLQVGTPIYQVLQLLPNPSFFENVRMSEWKTTHNNILEHLTCFLPGTMALSVMTQWEHLASPESLLRYPKFPDPSDVNLPYYLISLIQELELNQSLLEDEGWVKRFNLLIQMELSKFVLDTCVLGYFKSDSLLGFEGVRLVDQPHLSNSKSQSVLNESHSIEFQQKSFNTTLGSLLTFPMTLPLDLELPSTLGYWVKRPETIESLYYLHYYTGDPKYRRIGARLFDAIDKKLKVRGGYASSNSFGQSTDGGESFWIAETLKYFFLLFAPHEFMDLNKFVFNTEAHPFPIIFQPLSNKTRIATDEMLSAYSISF